jgi:hypothetical protein
MKNFTHTALKSRLFYKTVIAFIFPLFGFSQVMQTELITSGTSWTVPANVTSITVECWGGGGAGARSTSNGCGRGAGGGGAYALKNNIGVLPGQIISYAIGNGGNGGNVVLAQKHGGETWFLNTSTVLAEGGRGVENNTRIGGLGGQASNSIGDIVYSGGKGGDGRDGCGGSAESGSGGGGAGSTGDGAGGINGLNASINRAGGTGASQFGGNGGAGLGNNGNGNPGLIYGGGGSGGKRASTGIGGDRNGGNGAQGLIRITYYYNYQATYTAMNTGSTTWCPGETRNVSVTISNSGTLPWTDGAGEDFNIGVKWNADADYFVTVDAQNLAPGATQTYTFTVTAPSTPGTENLTFNVERSGHSWFGGTYTSAAQTIITGPTVNAGADLSICTGGSASLNANVSPGVGIDYFQDFNGCNAVNCGGWTISGGGAPSITSVGGNGYGSCTNSSIKSNIYGTLPTATLVSNASLGSSNGLPATLSFVYRCVNWSSTAGNTNGGNTAANSCTITASWATAAGGPWNTIGSFNNAALGSCTNYSFPSFIPTAGQPVFIRIVAVRNGGDFWIVMDDISLTQSSPTYSWSPATALSSTTILNPTTSTASTITYTLTATANGCSTSDDVTITISDPEITGTTDICVGSTSDLDAGETDWVSLPTGGTISTLGDNERIHTFNSSGVFTTAQTINNAQVLVVGGGGKGGANGGGGGGAGGVIYETGLSIATGSPAVTVGLGATTFAVGQRGATGGSSTFLTYTAGGGGGGGGRDTDQAGGAGGGTGGSGGGGGNNLSIGGAGSTGGNNGGTSSADFCASTVSGGGGGAGGPAGLVTINANRRLNISSAGGIGVSNSISGSPITYGVGGMGIAYALVTAPIAACGAGTDYATDAAASDGQATRYANGTANRGNGGGGGAGNGGDGVVIVRYRQPKWVSSDPSIASVNELTGVVTGVSPGSATITYYSVSGCSSSTSVTISEASTAPTLITGTGNSCHGTEVTLTASGSTLASGSDYEWFTGSCGGTAAGTGASITVTPTASTTYYVRASGNSVCPATACINGNVTLPTAGTNLSTNGETATCVVEGSNWIRFYAPSGNLILAINPNGENLGNVTVTSYVGAPGTMFACDNPGNTFYETAYMGRSWIITSENAPTNPVSVQYPFSNGELNALETLSLTTLDNLTDDVDDRDDLVLTKFTADNPAEENATPTDNCTVNGVTRVLNQASNGANPYGLTNAQYVIFNLSEFSENFLHGSTGPSALPVELTSFSATCNADFVQLNWTTGSELNSDKFIIESSRDLSTWNILGEVKSAGNSSQVTHYQFVDEFTSGLTYYRLRQVDFDGKVETFSSIFANCSASTNSITVYPNPTKGEFTIVLNSEVQFKNASLIITDISGKTIVAEPIQIVNGHTEIYKDLAEFKSGTYFIYIKTDKNTFKPVKIVKAQ